MISFSRAIGETMAVMMVIGNAPIFPKLLSKAQTIPSLIALEIGMSEVYSEHYYALFPSGIPLGFSVKNFKFIPEIPLKNTKENIKKIVLITIKIDIYAKSLINLSLNLIINSTLSINNK